MQPIAVIGPAWVVVLVVVLQFVIILTALTFVIMVWMAVFDFVGKKSTKRAQALSSIIGTVNSEASVGTFRAKAIGTGLGLTVIIFVLAVAAMWVIGYHTVL